MENYENENNISFEEETNTLTEEEIKNTKLSNSMADAIEEFEPVVGVEINF